MIDVEPMKDLSSLSDKELVDYKEYCERKATFYNIQQMCKKVAINGCYGACGTPLFRYYEPNIASSITAMGRQIVKANEKAISQWINNLINPGSEYQSYVLAGDTDSVAEKTIVEVTGREVHGFTLTKACTIKDLYDLVDTKEIDLGNGKFVKKIPASEELYITTIKDGQKINTPIHYVMKHKVEKEMFLVKSEEKEVKVTRDHSIMVLREEELTEVQPFCIKKEDKILVDA